MNHAENTQLFAQVLSRLLNLAKAKYGTTGHTSISLLVDGSGYTALAEWTNGVERKNDSGTDCELWRACELLAASLKGERPPLPGYKRAVCYACRGAKAPKCQGCQGRGYTDILMVYQLDENGRQL